MSLKLIQSYDNEFCDLMKRLRGKYPSELFSIEGIGESQLDVHQASKAFFKSNSQGSTADYSVDPNANVSGRDVITYDYELPKPIMRLNSLYNLWSKLKEIHGKELADAVIEAEISGAIYINDSHNVGKPYCFNYSTHDIALHGIPQMGRLNITRPKSLSSFLHQVEQFTVIAANSTLGATGLADLLIVAAWYVDRIMETGMDHKTPVCSGTMKGTMVREEKIRCYVSELLVHLIYTLNFEFRGNQSPFTNVSVYDKFFLNQLIPSYEIEGKTPKIETVQMLQEIFLTEFNEELSRNPLTFPVITACFSVTEDGERKIQDKDFLEMISGQNLKYGFINIYCGVTSTLSSCCRLRSSASDLGYTNSFGSGSTKIGSLGVVTINLPRIAWLNCFDDEGNHQTPDWEQFLEDVRAYTFIASAVNHAKRLFIKDRIDRGALPLYTHGFMDLSRQYSTCGFTGLYEAVQTMGYGIVDPNEVEPDDGLNAAKEVLDTINEVNEYMSKQLGTPHNMEQVPAESSAVKLAKKDKVMGMACFDDMVVEYSPELYSNQFIPLWADGVDIFRRIEIQGELDKFCTGGAIAHLNIAQRISRVDTMMQLISYACSKGVIYFAVNYAINKCENNHMTVGNSEECPICHAPITDTYTRVVGFLTNTKHWNQTRREVDWPNRIFYDSAERRK